MSRARLFAIASRIVLALAIVGVAGASPGCDSLADRPHRAVYGDVFVHTDTNEVVLIGVDRIGPEPKEREVAFSFGDGEFVNAREVTPEWIESMVRTEFGERYVYRIESDDFLSVNFGRSSFYFDRPSTLTCCEIDEEGVVVRFAGGDLACGDPFSKATEVLGEPTSRCEIPGH